eukprot:TRINITY_DN776_c0_g1_i1.p1 TRINITY_DN776_c0_g1~~TRINITY_DN776_c0_g1_i1.p1  ORF type:complete len:378 (-),score=114.17 TRINITY_DN776_c0_g1_i1:218-1351(-)
MALFLTGTILSFLINSGTSLVSLLASSSSLSTIAVTTAGPFLVKWTLKQYFKTNYGKMYYVFELYQGGSPGNVIAEEVLKNASLTLVERAARGALFCARVASSVLYVTLSGSGKLTYKILSGTTFLGMNAVNGLLSDPKALPRIPNENKSLSLEEDWLLIKKEEEEEEEKINVNTDFGIDDFSMIEGDKDKSNSNNNPKEEYETVNFLLDENIKNASFLQERSILTSKTINNFSVNSFSDLNINSSDFSNDLSSIFKDNKNNVNKNDDNINIKEDEIQFEDLIDSTTSLFDPYQNFYGDLNTFQNEHNDDNEDQQEDNDLLQSFYVIEPTTIDDSSLYPNDEIINSEWKELTDDSILELNDDQLLNIELSTSTNISF